MLLALTEVGNLTNTYSHDAIFFASLWLLVNFLFCWVHIIASFYIAVSINHHKRNQAIAASTTITSNKRNTNSTALVTVSAVAAPWGPDRTIFRRASNLFCYDPVLALYIVTVGCYAGFLNLPRLFDLDKQQEQQQNGDTRGLYIHEKVIATVGFAWAFLVFGMGALALSFGFAYIDATRKNWRREKSGTSSSSRFTSQGLSEFDEEDEVSATRDDLMTDYSNMEEGGGRHPRKENPRSNSPLKGAKRGRARSAHRDQGPHVVLAEYLPPMITYHDQGIEMLSETEESRQKIRVEKTLNKVILSDYVDDDDDTIGFGTDLETDVDDLARTSLDTMEQDEALEELRTRRGRRPKVTVSYYDDETDHQPTTSCEVQDETESTDPMMEGEDTETERYMAGGESTDGGAGPSFETNDMDRAIDFTDTEATAVASLDRILAISKDPTGSLSLDGLEEDTESVTGSMVDSIAGSIASLVNSITGASIGGSSTNSAMKKNRKYSKSPSKRAASGTKEDPVQLLTRSESLGLPNNALADDTTHDTDTDKSQSALDETPLATKHTKLRHRMDALASKTMDHNFNDASLTYSTSIGTIVGPLEPLSFVDGGGPNDGINITPPSMKRHHMGVVNVDVDVDVDLPTPTPRRRQISDPPGGRKP